MNRLLKGCTLAAPFDKRAPAYSAVAASLGYQAIALGMEVESSTSSSGRVPFSAEFKTPDTSPISCEIRGWADASEDTATELVIQAACGLMSVHGRASGKAQPLGLDYVSTLSATLALQGAMATAVGQLRGLAMTHCSVSMASAALLATGQYLAGATASESPETILPGSVSPINRPPFVSADGVVFELETLDAGPWQRFWASIGVSTETAGKGWTAFLLRYAKAVSPIPADMVDALAALEYQTITEICAATGVAICPLRTISERATDEDAKRMWQRGPWAFTTWQHPNATPPNPAGDRLPLSGLTVIESCRRIQGPLAGHLLALLGAEVIRIEPPGGDPLRGMPPMAEGVSARFDALNRHKTIVEVDIKSAAGQRQIKALVQQADVFLHNWAPGKAAALNLDHADLARISPSLVYAYAGGWGTDEPANVAHNPLPGTDFMAQAYSGVARQIAAASGTRGGSLFTVLDVLGGVVAAQGVTAALLHRCMSNNGVRVDTSLLGSATLLCAADLRGHYEGLPPISMPKSVVAAVYPTQQGAIAIECCDQAGVTRLAEILGLEHTLEDGAMQQALLTKTAAQWYELFEQADIPAAVVTENLAEVQHHPRLSQALEVGPYTRVASPWSFR